MGALVLASVLLTLAAMAGGDTCPAIPLPGMVARSTRFGGVVAPVAAQADDAVTAGDIALRASKRYLGIDPEPFLIAPKSQPVGGCIAEPTR